ncbi:tryptophan synthase subunit alpha [Peribacillus kribbensis]|uniref:tryptophan synthase subunit alpha n=1 Tax=Peribacillus kribbensis TaxID=356658 RepID=UPI000418798A|nr:tryptophan synthase subunit alpha [Peribacillus kribbensis]
MSKRKLEALFQTLIKEDKKAFTAYIMGGDGGIDRLEKDLLFLQESGADLIEVGVPFSDPVADGPVIQEAGLRALKNGVSLEMILNKLTEIKEKITVPIILMTYINPVLQYGLEQFADASRQGGIAGCIFPDLPYEEEALVKEHLAAADIAIIRLAALTSGAERLKTLTSDSEGFIYAVTVNGVTGERAELNAAEIKNKIDKIKSFTNTPVLAGFGISSADAAQSLLPSCEGVIVGSKIVQAFHEGRKEEIREFISSIKGLSLISG